MTIDANADRPSRNTAEWLWTGWMISRRYVFEAFYPLVDFGDMHEDDEMILFKNSGYHRTIFINPHALDYVSLPTHKFEAGSLEMAAETLDALGDDPTPTATPKTNKKRQTK